MGTSTNSEIRRERDLEVGVGDLLSLGGGERRQSENKGAREAKNDGSAHCSVKKKNENKRHQVKAKEEDF